MEQEVTLKWNKRWRSSGAGGGTQVGQKVEVALTLKRSRRWQSIRARGGTHMEKEVALMRSRGWHS